MSYSDYIKKKRQGIYIGPTKGHAITGNDRRACLCKDKNTYSRECCDGYLINQSVGDV